MIATKPPPKPPKFGHTLPAAPRQTCVNHTKRLALYELPMHSETVPAWVHVLNVCGYPLDVVVIDFETYFDSDYRMARAGDGLTTIEYVQDGRFEILTCAFTLMDGRDPFSDYEAATFVQVREEMVATQLKCLQKKYGENLERCTVVLQNAEFDALILALKYGIYPPHVIDVLGLSRHWHARSKHDLGTQADRYGLEEKGETEEFKGLTFRRRLKKQKGRKKGPKLPLPVPLITEEQTAKLVAYNRNDNLREWELFTILLPKLSNPTTELRLMQHTLELWTKPALKVDFAKGEELIAKLNAGIDEALKAVVFRDALGHADINTPVSREQISGNNSYEALLVEALKRAGENPQTFYKPCKKGYKLADAKDDPERELLLKHADPEVRALANARAVIKSTPIHISRVERIMRMAKAWGGWLGVPLKYCGAHTGRWSGGQKINLQNLPKNGLLAEIRHMLIAPDGQTLVIVDAAAIEARVLAWIAGQWDLVEKFAKGAEIYCGFASKVLGWPVRKPKEGGIPAVEKRHKWARNAIGKIGVLGCGYGMGTDKLFDLAESTGNPITLEMAEKIKVTYRSENTAIVQFWKDIEKAFVYTAKYKRSCTMPRGLRFDSSPDCDVILTLPNGRELKYPQVKLVQDKYGDKIEIYNSVLHSWEHAWGGVLTENVVQAISRDILAECFLRLEDRGYHTAFHCHDEVVPVVAAADGPAALEAAIEEMARPPAWGPECPLGAEGSLSERYKK